MPEARHTMPFDPNSPRNPLPPLNDGYPDDWHVPTSAQDDSFPDDWHVPPSAQPSVAWFSTTIRTALAGFVIVKSTRCYLTVRFYTVFRRRVQSPRNAVRR